MALWILNGQKRSCTPQVKIIIIHPTDFFRCIDTYVLFSFIIIDLHPLYGRICPVNHLIRCGFQCRGCPVSSDKILCGNLPAVRYCIGLLSHRLHKCIYYACNFFLFPVQIRAVIIFQMQLTV